MSREKGAARLLARIERDQEEIPEPYNEKLRTVDGRKQGKKSIGLIAAGFQAGLEDVPEEEVQEVH